MSSITLRNARWIGAARRHHQHRQDESARRREFPRTGTTGRTDPAACRARPSHRELAALHRSVGPAEPAAGKHRIGEIGDGPNRATRTSSPCARTAETGTSATRITRSRSSLTQAAVAASASRASVEIVGRHRKARAIAAEHERKFAPLQRIGDGRDDGRARHVHRLVALVRDRLGRFHDIGDADRSSHPAAANTAPGPSGWQSRERPEWCRKSCRWRLWPSRCGVVPLPNLCSRYGLVWDSGSAEPHYGFEPPQHQLIEPARECRRVLRQLAIEDLRLLQQQERDIPGPSPWPPRSPRPADAAD